ncbi:MAG TPA: tetratricopeptide repeat protein, partial [Chitinophagales bacterium]|nr:tetratricopeptide repeat protein [Chitinophagales bacterium]
LVQISLAANIVLPLPGIVGERVLFTASLSFAILLAWLINYLLNKQPEPVATKKKEQSKTVTGAPTFNLSVSKAQIAALALILIFYSYQTIARNADWKDTITLFEADMPHLTSSAKANYMMAKELRRLYRTDKNLTAQQLETQSAKAIHYYNQAIAAYPQYAIAIEELAMIHAVELNNNSVAIPLFERAYNADSTLWRSASNLGKAYQMSGDTAAAVKWYERSLKAKSDNPKALVELGKLYYLRGDKVKALATNDTLMVLNPESYLPYYNYAIYYMLEGDTAKAVNYFEEDIKRGEREKFPYAFLFRYYLQQRDTASAVRVRNMASSARTGP